MKYDYWQIGVISSVIIILIFLFFYWLKIKKAKVYSIELFNHPDIEPSIFTTDEKPSIVSPITNSENLIDDLIILSIVAKNDSQFASYDLFQTITGAGFQFGAMNIFHYNTHKDDANTTLFSLSSATEPGEFDLDRLGDFSCKGLTLFMNLRYVKEPAMVFDLMLEKAQQLADDLDGELRAGQRHPLDDISLLYYRNKISTYTSK